MSIQGASLHSCMPEARVKNAIELHYKFLCSDGSEHKIFIHVRNVSFIFDVCYNGYTTVYLHNTGYTPRSFHSHAHLILLI